MGNTRTVLEVIDHARRLDDDRWLRVILLEDGETVRNAFFDRGAEK